MLPLLVRATSSPHLARVLPVCCFSTSRPDSLDARPVRAKLPSASLPLVDLHPFLDLKSSARSKAACAAQVHSACVEVGFFLIAQNTEEQQQRMVDMERLSRDFFSLPDALKRQLQTDGYGGYRPIGAELSVQTDGQVSGDCHEALDFTLQSLPTVGWKVIPSGGLWQEHAALASIRTAMISHNTALNNLGVAVVRAIAHGLSLDPREAHFLVSSFEHSTAAMRILRYPTAAKLQEVIALRQNLQQADRENMPPLGIGTGAHTDYECLTLLHATHEGLEIQPPGQHGDWFAVPLVPNSLVCNIGDTLQFWTGGQYVSTRHRVVAGPTDAERMSFPYFLGPAFNTPLRPLVPPEECKTQAVSTVTCYGDYLTAKLNKAFPSTKY